MKFGSLFKAKQARKGINDEIWDAQVETERRRKSIFNPVLPYAMCLMLPFCFSAKAAAEGIMSQKQAASQIEQVSHDKTFYASFGTKSVGGMGQSDGAMSVGFDFENPIIGNERLGISNLCFSIGSKTRTATIEGELAATCREDIGSVSDEIVKFGDSVDVAECNFMLVSVTGGGAGTSGTDAWFDVTDNSTSNYIGTVKVSRGAAGTIYVGNKFFKLDLLDAGVGNVPADTYAKVNIEAVSESVNKRICSMNPTIQENLRELSADFYNAKILSFRTKMGITLGYISRSESYMTNYGLVNNESNLGILGVSLSAMSPDMNFFMDLRNTGALMSLIKYGRRYNASISYSKERNGDKIIWESDAATMEFMYYLIKTRKLVLQIGAHASIDNSKMSVVEEGSTFAVDSKPIPYGLEFVIKKGGVIWSLQVDDYNGAPTGKLTLLCGW
jgi:hypothetical protein